jgi:hypothetical protein
MASSWRQVLVGWGILCAGGLVHADNDADILSPRSLGMGESLRAAASGSLATTQNPAGVALTKSYVIEGGYGYRPEDHSNIEAVSICDSVTSRVGACLAYNHLSADLTTAGQGDRSRHELGLTVATPLGESFALGVTQRYVSYTEEPTGGLANNSHDGYMLDAGMTLKLMPTLAVAAVGYNLIGNDDAQYARALGFGMAFNVAPTFLIAADGRYDFAAENGRYGGGAEYVFSGADGQQGVPLRLGYVYDAGHGTSYLTGGLGFMTPRVAIDVGARTQVAGPGNEFMIQAGLRLFLPN